MDREEANLLLEDLPRHFIRRIVSFVAENLVALPIWVSIDLNLVAHDVSVRLSLACAQVSCGWPRSITFIAKTHEFAYEDDIEPDDSRFLPKIE